MFVQYIAVVTVFLFTYIPMGDLAKTKEGIKVDKDLIFVRFAMCTVIDSRQEQMLWHLTTLKFLIDF